ncbi:hypothetical protein N0V93_001826 [Gnomoniopsis smithogilvyi]|uniref:G-patch domain-containing protein n=1 Tax=Gnomoniopsis smithogilvyi TaxID=1191159 RepID=A0A9W9D215_9PEZI|nr:hypothetical protein N0V93_001826 [Gnomoniopsis smithogilvyi]
MDAHALLTSQGWRGSGHSLHKTDDSIGLARPILVSRKNNSLGIGRKNHVTSDQWWLNAFDEQLKSLDTSNKTSVVQTKKNTTKLEGLLTHGAGKYTGANALYACFVSGGFLQGTLQTEDDQSTDATPEAEVVPVKKETKEERRARKEEKRRRKAAKLAKQSAVVSKVPETPKSKHTAKDKSESKKDKKSGRKTDTVETKEERRARKEAKRKEKAKKEKRKKIEKG